MIRNTSREAAPWHVIPADNKGFARLAVASIIVDAMRRLDLRFPEVDGKELPELEKVRKALLAEGKAR